MLSLPQTIKLMNIKFDQAWMCLKGSQEGEH